VRFVFNLAIPPLLTTLATEAFVVATIPA